MRKVIKVACHALVKVKITCISLECDNDKEDSDGQLYFIHLLKPLLNHFTLSWSGLFYYFYSAIGVRDTALCLLRNRRKTSSRMSRQHQSIRMKS